MISFIVPVYNAQTYLSECLDSIQDQTYTDLEIVCIDNMSTDASPAILEQHARDDARIHIVHERGRGVSAARNRGLEVATGEHVCFVDADDYIDSDYAQQVADAIAEQHADVILIWYDSIYEDGKRSMWKQPVMPEPFMQTADLADKLFMYSYSPNATKTYRRAFLEHHRLRYNTHYTQGEDVLFACSAIMLSETVTQCTGKPLYHYRRNVEGSASMQRSLEGGSLQIFDVLDDLVQFNAEHNASLDVDTAITRLALSEMNHAANIATTLGQYEEAYERFVRDWRERVRELGRERCEPYGSAYDVFAATETVEESLFANLTRRNASLGNYRIKVTGLKDKLAVERKRKRSAQKKAERLAQELEEAKGNQHSGGIRGFLKRLS